MASEITASITFLAAVLSLIIAPESPITLVLFVVLLVALAWETVTIVKRARGLR